MTPAEIERVFDWYTNLGPSVVNVTGSLYQLSISEQGFINKGYVWLIYLRDGPKQIFWFPMLLKKYSDFGGGKKNNLIQSFCHITKS